MSKRGGGGAWLVFIVMLVANSALYGAVTYLKHYNPAHWIFVSDDYGKILLASQYPDRLDADSVAFTEVSRVELVGNPGLLGPRRAEVFVDTVTGRRVRVHFGSNEMYQFATGLSKRLDRPLVVTNYERELKARDNPLEAVGAGSTSDGIPELPQAR